MFLDIRNFTGFAEARSPEEVVEYLESLFGFMIEIVNRRRGIINKFLGDGFMAVFGAPISDGRDPDGPRPRQGPRMLHRRLQAGLTAG
jgi:adenylate cyclase